MKWHALLVVLAGLLVAADAPKDSKVAVDKLTGAWQCVSGEDPEGDKIPDEIIKKARMTFTDDKVTIELSTEQKEEASYKLDPAQNPKTIDFTFTTGPDKDKTYKGIYQLEGDMLKLCLSENADQRPKEFKTNKDMRIGIMVLKREKP